jgi:hypothetical protein
MGWWAGWWKRRTCTHHWELVEKEKILGQLSVREWGGSSVTHRYIYVYRCPICGATKRETAL